MAVLSQRTHWQYFRCRDLPRTVPERQIKGILKLPDVLLENHMCRRTSIRGGTRQYWYDPRLCEFCILVPNRCFFPDSAPNFKLITERFPILPRAHTHFC